MDPTNDVFFILSGKARVNIYSPSGRVVGFRELRPADMFGEFSALDKQPRSASVEAEKDCKIAILRSVDFLHFIDHDPSVMKAFMLHLVEQMRSLTVRVYEFSTLAVKNRIQADLVRLARDSIPDLGDPTNTALILEAPKHAEIAARISTHREAVTKHLNELSRIGLIERQGRALLIKDVERLEFMVREATDQ